MPNALPSLALSAAAVAVALAAVVPAAASAVTVDPILTSTDANGGANQGKVYDYGTKLTGTAGFATVASAGGGGLLGTHLVTPSPATAAWVWGRSDTLAFADPAGDTTRTGTRVDGHNAYVGPSWEDVVTPAQQVVLRDLTPFPVVSPAAGADGVAEHDVVVRCTAGTDVDHHPPMGNRCTALGDAGVGLDVATTASASGRVVTRKWAWSSTDGAAHQVRFTVDWRAGDNGLGRAREWRWTGAGAYALAQPGDQPAAPAAGPWDLVFRSVGAADGDEDEGVGGLTTDVAPVALEFTASRTLQATYVVTTPATITTTLVSEATQAALDAALAAAHPRAPEVTPPGTTTPAAPGATPTPTPTPGTATRPPAATPPARPVVVTQGRASRRGRVLKLGLAVRCPGMGPRCATRITLRAGRRTLGTATVSTAATKTTTLSVRLSAKALRALPRRGRLAVALRLTRGTLAPATISRTIPAARAR